MIPNNDFSGFITSLLEELEKKLSLEGTLNVKSLEL